MCLFNYGFLRVLPSSGIVGSFDSFIFSFFKVLSSIVAGSIYLPTNSARGFRLLHIFSSTCCLYTFWWLPTREDSTCGHYQMVNTKIRLIIFFTAKDGYHGVAKSRTWLSDWTEPNCCAKSFNFNQVPFVYLCFYFHYSRRWVMEDLAMIYIIQSSAYIFLHEFYSFWSYHLGL